VSCTVDSAGSIRWPARQGDAIVVVAIDRLGRSAAEVMGTIREFGERGIVLRSIRIGIDTATAAGSQLPAPVARLGDLDRACNHYRHHRLSRKVDRSLGSGHGDSPHPRGEVADLVVAMRVTCNPSELVGLGCTISSWGAGVPDTRAGVDRAGARGDGELIPFVAGL
jgi:hypothetical protein